MSIPFTCPHCGARTDVDEQYAGQTGPCAGCGQTITVPPVAGMSAASSEGGSHAWALVIVLVIIGGVVVVGCLGLTGMLFWARGVPAPPPVATAVAVPVAAKAAASQCGQQLARIGMAMQQYHAVYGTFPPAYLADAQGKPMHSWRVLLLPFLGDNERELYRQYRLDEPWDGPNNSQLHTHYNNPYHCWDDAAGRQSDTNFMMVVGKGTVSEGAGATKLSEITDGAETTIHVVAVDGLGIHWLAPKDLKLDEMSMTVGDLNKPAIRYRADSDGPRVLACDGAVHVLPTSTPPDDVKALLTIAGGETAAWRE